ncbi:hypothetical protein TIFTF001_032830 [Ficus carica]|uniref:Gag-pol polyprotein n=1 Tax=Ficus carica TaxID=3494 RepID=A0AA88DXR6_FICCA|nr:hypothetical protein TIFTF001_032830 [Ficus carica]
MVRPRTRANPNPQEPDLANIENLIPPVVPQVPEVHQEIPRSAEVSLAPVGIQANPPWVREDLLYERFRRMKVPEFEGPADPIEADNWLMDVQLILDFMRLSKQEKVLCASFALKKDARHWRMTVQMHKNDEFNSFRQGSMTVMEAVKKFEQLARLCLELVQNETEKAKRMMRMFQIDIAKKVSAGNREAWAQVFKARKEERAIVKHPQARQNPKFYSKGQSSNIGQNTRQFGKNKRKRNVMNQGQQRNYPQKKINRGNEGNNDNNNSYPVCAQCGKKHVGISKSGSNACYICGREGHYARNYTLNNQNTNPQFPNRNPSSQLHAAQVKIEGPSLAQGRLEAPEPQAQIYAYTKGDIEAGTSSVVTGQISVATYDVLILLDFGTIHSFVSKEFAQKLGRGVDSLEQPFRTSLLLGKILLSDY